MGSKKPFLTLNQAREIVKTYPTPFHIYDEAGIRRTARALKAAFGWNPGFREYFAVKATPNPFKRRDASLPAPIVRARSSIWMILR